MGCFKEGAKGDEFGRSLLEVDGILQGEVKGIGLQSLHFLRVKTVVLLYKCFSFPTSHPLCLSGCKAAGPIVLSWKENSRLTKEERGRLISKCIN